MDKKSFSDRLPTAGRTANRRRERMSHSANTRPSRSLRSGCFLSPAVGRTGILGLEATQDRHLAGVCGILAGGALLELQQSILSGAPPQAMGLIQVQYEPAYFLSVLLFFAGAAVAFYVSLPSTTKLPRGFRCWLLRIPHLLRPPVHRCCKRVSLIFRRAIRKPSSCLLRFRPHRACASARVAASNLLPTPAFASADRRNPKSRNRFSAPVAAA